jgi:presenilin-like A22 family membrane protease
MAQHRGLILLISMFLVTNFLGLMAAQNLQAEEAIQETKEQNESAASGIYIFVVIGVSTAILLILYKYNIQFIIKAWFALAILLSTLIFFYALFRPLTALVLTLAVMGVRYFWDDPAIINAMTVFAFAGFGAYFGSIFGLEAILALMLVLSVYDYISVNISKHMVALAKFGMQTNTFMGFTYPKEEGGIDMENGDLQDLEPDESAETAEQDAAEDAAGNGGMGVLGGGDIVIPLAFAAALLPAYGAIPAMVSIVGAATGLTFLLVKAQRGTFYPAIPPVVAGSLAGWGIAWAALNVLLPLL